ncbi:MAG: TldD/PmbA family protein [Candidatus Zixiibacteriota bacterium]|nr:MAG: TldD/PmbA family protein [candidate division Zixibacteria bacterium]
MSRRQFLETGAKGIAIASIPGIFKFDPSAAFATPLEDIVNLKEYYAHFGVDEKTVLEVMQTALEQGGDYCDIYFQHSIANTVGLEDNAVNRAYANVDFGVGIRVVSGDQTGYSFTEEITPKAMKLAAATAANIADQAKTVAPVGLEHKTLPDYYPVKTLWENVKIDRKIPYLQEINDKVFAKDSRIIKSRIRFSDSSSYVLIANSEGKTVCDYRPMTSLRVSCTAEQNGQRETNGYSLAARHGIEFFTPEKVQRLADEAVKRTIDLFEAVKPEAGEMEVVLAPGSSGILLHEAIGHGMEADFNRKNISIFADKIGKPVAPEFVTIVDNGTNLNIRGSLNIDDEGNDTEETYLVRDGILATYLHDRISARHYKARHTGNGRRESFRYAPIPRMRNTYMLPGPHAPEEIIKSVKKGLYAETFTNGQVFIGAGDFTFYVKSGNLIEDGKLTKSVKDINIIGNGPEVLANIVMVADDLKFAEGGWTCGKDGQGVPVSQGLPTVKVSSITVGGVS